MASITKDPTQPSPRIAPLASEQYVPRAMPQILNSFNMTTTFLVSIYVATSAATAAAGGAAAFTYLVLVGLTFFVPCLIATAQLGVLLPHEGSLYNWTHRTLGGYWSFFSGFCAWFPSVLIISSEADLFVTFIQAMHSSWLAAPWQQGLVIIVVLLVSGLICIQSFRTVQYILNVLVGLTLLASLLLGLSCMLWLLKGHHSLTSFSHWGDWSFNPANFSLFGFIVFAYIGTEAPLNMAGEMGGGKRTIKRHLLWGGLLIFVLYMVNTFSVLVVQGNNATNPFAIVSTVDMVLGKGAGNIAAVCFMASFLAPVLAFNYVYARLLFVAGVDRRLPVSFGRLNNKRVPANAMIFQTIMATSLTVITFILAPAVALFAKPEDFSTEVSYVTQAASVLVWAISAMFLFINLVVYYRRKRQEFLQGRIFPLPVLWLSVLLGSLSCILAAVDTLLYPWVSLINQNQWWYLVGGLTFVFLLIGAIASMYGNSEASWQDISSL